MIVFFSKLSYSQSTPGIITDWMDFAGISDTLTVIPVVKDDSSNIISVGVNVDSMSGPDILVTKLDSGGSVEWQHTYSSAGFNRDQAIAVAVDDKCSIYVAGVLYSSATNFDWVILKYGYDGTLAWTYTLNGTANNYDAPAAIKIKNSFVYVTGEVYDSVTQLNYATIQLNRTTGALNWKREYDFNSLFDIAFAMDISGTSTGIKVAGASQDNLTKWNYCSISYDSMGVANDTTRIVGTSNSFDRPMAARGDVFGNFYITGAASDSGASFNVRTAKIDSAGNLAWVADFGSNGKDDEGNDIIVDDSGYIYVCGKSNSLTAIQQDVVLIKYSNNGTEQYFRMFDSDSAADEAHKMCFDNYGNIVMTGTGTRENADILTVAYNRAGDFLWQIFFNGDYDGEDKGTGIIADAYGNIFVTGEVQITDTTWQQVTIKYKTDYFLVPQDTVPAPSSLLFYPNSGQIIDTHDSIRYDVAFYTINQFPKLYFHQDSISFVMAHVDSDTATTDTLEKITMNFAEINMANCDPYTSNTHDTDQVLNYFLGHCPDGITGITGSEKIMYSNVYENTDIIFSNNNAGMKFQIIMNPGAEPQAVLHFTGHQSLQLVNNADLQVSGVLGSFIYERPLVYQLDYFGTRISLGWLASYHISGDDVGFILSGNYDNRLPLVVECARETHQSPSILLANIGYSTYTGDIAEDVSQAITKDLNNNIIVTGHTFSATFPLAPGVTNIGPSNRADAFIYKLSDSGVFLWGTLYGGSVGTGAFNGIGTWGTDVVTDGANDVYVVGITLDTNLPQNITNSYATLTAPYQGHDMHGDNDNFVLKLKGTTGTLMWANYVGGATTPGIVGTEETNFCSISIEYDAATLLANIYVSGSTFATDIPKYSFGGAYNQSSTNGGLNGYILSMDQDGAPIWGSYFGGSSTVITDVQVVHSSGSDFHLYVAGQTNDFTYDANTCAPPSNGDFPNCNTYNGDQFTYSAFSTRAFIAEFNSSYELVWSTILGNEGCSPACPISTSTHCLSGYDNTIYMSLMATFDDMGFPTPATCTGCFIQPSYPDIFNSNADGYIARFDSRLLTWGTFVGGTGDDRIQSIYTDGDKLFVTGFSFASNLPTSADYCTIPPFGDLPLCDGPNNFYFQSAYNAVTEDAYLASFNSSNQVVWATPIGGNEGEISFDVTKDEDYIFLVGTTSSHYITSTTEDYPQQFLGGAYNQNTNSGGGDGFLTRFENMIHIGIDEPDLPENSIYIFPNPCTNSFSFLFNTKSTQKLKYSVTNLLGEILRTGTLRPISGNKFSIDVSTLSSGIYFISIDTDNFIATSKLIKQ